MNILYVSKQREIHDSGSQSRSQPLSLYQSCVHILRDAKIRHSRSSNERELEEISLLMKIMKTTEYILVHFVRKENA